MNPRVIDVKPAGNYTVQVWFKKGEKGEKGVLDMKPYLDKGIFRELKDISMFNSVHPLPWHNSVGKRS
jgi:DUF971 family protein